MFKKLFGSKRKEWLSAEAISNALCSQNIDRLMGVDHLYNVSPDNTYCILVRDHAAWLDPSFDDERWRDGNIPPDAGQFGRTMLNVFKVNRSCDGGYWYKLFVPKVVQITGIANDEGSSTRFTITTNSGTHSILFAKLDGFMRLAITGNAQTEENIHDRFTQFVNL